MQKRELGTSGLKVGALGLGCMGMSGAYGEADRGESIATIHAALEAGVTLIDTGDFYAMGHNELLVAEALKGRRDKAHLSVKFGAQRGPDGAWYGFDARPAAVKTALAYTLQRLGTDYVDIYRPARLDPNVPIEETIGAIADLVKAGYVRHIGLSEVGATTIDRAAAVHPIADLQIEYAIISRGPEATIMPALDRHGIGMTAYGVLARGLISGHWSAAGTTDPGDFRRVSPRFAPENVTHNLTLVEALRAIADGKGISVAQLAIAWVMAKGERIVPVIGAKRPARLTEALGALDVTLSAAEIDAIEQAVPAGAARGGRYAEAQMAALDSEH